MTRRLKRTLLILATVLATLFVLAAPFLAYQRQWSLTKETFRKRANDVQPLIAAIYRHSFETGEWPESIDSVSEQDFDLLREDWQYAPADEGLPPVLRTQGPLHMKLEYWFRDRGDLSAPGGWSCRCEGDPVKIDCEERIPSMPESRHERSI